MISPILFALTINMLAKSVEVQCRGPHTMSGVRQPLILALMDDLTVTTISVPDCRWILNDLKEMMIFCAHMSFKPAKSRSLMLWKGKVTDKYCFSLGSTKIP